VNELESAASHGPADDAPPAPSTLRSPRQRRCADSGSFPALSAPITVRARRFSRPEREPPDSPENLQRASPPPLSSFPHRLAAPAFGAILSGVLTYCLHQCGEPMGAQARLVRARTTYAAEGVVAEPVRFEVELPGTVAPAERAAPPVATRTKPAPVADRAAPGAERAARQDAAEPSSQLPVVRPIELQLARERPSRGPKATSRTKKREPGAARRRPRTRGRD